MDIPVFSPSQTSDFAFCERYGYLQQKGLKPLYVEYPEICAVLGTAVSAGLAEYRRAEQVKPGSGLLDDMTRAAYISLAIQDDAITKAGRVIGDVELWKSLPTKIGQALLLYKEHDPWKHCEVVEVEQVIPNSGNSRPDVIYRDEKGLFYNDDKTKIKLAKQWQEETFRDFEDGWQQKHCCFFKGITRFAVTLIILSPSPRVAYKTWTLSPTQLHQFVNDASQRWVRIAEVKQKTTAVDVCGHPTHKNQYGRCQYYQACVTDQLDPARINVHYRVQPRHEEGQCQSTQSTSPNS